MALSKEQIAVIMAPQKKKYDAVFTNSTRGKSALALAEIAMEHGSRSAQAAAELLLSMECEGSFMLERLLSFDSTNRAHADVVMQGYKPHELWPSKWMTEEGIDGEAIMAKLRERWSEND